MSIPALLDHIVIAGPDLAELVAWFRERTGVEAPAGGRHPHGTANHLLAFTVEGRRGPHYLELIGPDPASAKLPEAFGIPELTGPALRSYAIHPEHIEQVAATAKANGLDLGQVSDLERRTPDGELLTWRLTRGSRADAELPFLIDWGTTQQPGHSELPTIELRSFVLVSAHPEQASARLAAYGLPAGSLTEVVPARPGERPGLRLTVRTATGGDLTIAA